MAPIARKRLFERARARRLARGAAMVEAAFMALIFALIWNLAVYCAGLYMAKMEATYVARYHTLYYAEHDCTGTPPAYIKADFNGKGSGAGEAGQEGANAEDNPSGSNPGFGSTPSGDDMGGAKREGFFARGKGTASWTWVWNTTSSGTWTNFFGGALSGTSNVHSDSYVMCNEGPYGINAVKFFATFIQQGFGQIKGMLGF